MPRECTGTGSESLEEVSDWVNFTKIVCGDNISSYHETRMWKVKEKLKIRAHLPLPRSEKRIYLGAC